MTEDLQLAIEKMIGDASPSALKKASAALSKTYAQGKNSRSLFEDESSRLTYLAARMPATFGAVSAALQNLPAAPSSWLDLGAGPGTASWAAAELFPSSSRFTLIEQSPHAIALGKRLAEAHPRIQKAEWICASLPLDLPKADAAILSYALGELERPAAMIEKWWGAEIPVLIIVEPGTPRGFSAIRKARDQILSLGGAIAAPCPHSHACPMKESDWCHFSARIPRSRLHRYVKEGALGYEDEKFSYLIASKTPLAPSSSARILRHPLKLSGHVRLALCTSRGERQETVVGRSNKEFYRKARDASWGDPWEM